MNRADLADLMAFAAIAEELSFARAAARLGVSSSALSHSLRGLEARLDTKLLNRTTRSVAPTDAGRLLLERLRPAFDDIGGALDVLNALRSRPAGRVRLNANRWAAERLVAPKLGLLHERYPDVVLELSTDDGLADIVSAGFDAGIRPGQMLAKEMIAQRLEPDQPMAVIGSPGYFSRQPRPNRPGDLNAHRCLAYRHISSGRLQRWAFERDGQAVAVAIEPTFVTNDARLLIQAALQGIGLAYLVREYVEDAIASGALVEVLADWVITLGGNHVYYPSRRHVKPALRAVLDVITARENALPAA